MTDSVTMFDEPIFTTIRKVIRGFMAKEIPSAGQIPCNLRRDSFLDMWRSVSCFESRFNC